MLSAALPTLGWTGDLARLAVAAALGAVIGFERELREREAGLRTHTLVCVGSALFTIVSAYGFEGFLSSGQSVVRADPTRIAAQIVTGIGFLGAGAIIRHGFSVRGLTTAATLWVAAAIGIAAGAGYYSGAVITTAITLFALWPLRLLSFELFERLRPEERSIAVDLRADAQTAQLIDALEQRQARIEHIRIHEDDQGRTATVTLDTPSEQLLAQLADLEFVRGVEWRR